MQRTLCVFTILMCAWPCLAQTPAPQTLAYVLQAEPLGPTRTAVVNRLATCDRDRIILDTHFDGDPWPPEAIKSIRDGKPGRKVIAYLSIGEAEDYRDYWQQKWDANHDGKPDSGAPGFLCDLNPDWEGNYKVRYWQRDWQALILKRVNDILATQKFDGLYLDIVDGFEFFEHDAKTDQWIDNRPNPQTGNTYRVDMIRWVKLIADNARKINSHALIIPQNGVALLADKTFCQSIDAVGVEDLFTDGNKLQKPEDTQARLDFLKPFIATGKPVLLIEYPTHPAKQRLVIAQSKTLGMHLLITDRNLKTLGQSKVW
jgi:cysteinyl-tRNA synthetase